MTAFEIQKKTLEICKEKLGVDFSSVMHENGNTPIFNKPFNFEPYTLLYLILEIQKEYSIAFSENQLTKYGLLNFNGIVDAVLESLEDNQ